VHWWLLKNADEPGMFRKAIIKFGLPLFMLTADEPTASHTYMLKLPG
jgi:hypothetical protein